MLYRSDISISPPGQRAATRPTDRIYASAHIAGVGAHVITADAPKRHWPSRAQEGVP